LKVSDCHTLTLIDEQGTKRERKKEGNRLREWRSSHKDMMKLWVLRGLKKGILTTKFPKEQPIQDELSRKSFPPTPSKVSDWERGRLICPTGAIQYDSQLAKSEIDLGKCIYCQRCSSAGFEFPETRDSTSALKATFATNGDSAYESDERLLFEKYSKLWKSFKKSFHVLMIDVGSCNACNFEVLNLSNPYYDFNRLGIFFTNSPKHADALIVVGALNKAMVDVLKRTYENIPSPKLVISVGACSISGGIFQNTESFASPVRKVIPVDVVVPGCPPTPIQILQGLLIATGRIKTTESFVRAPTDIEETSEQEEEEKNEGSSSFKGVSG
jgi:Ni,Fe-hydrogenase III small subunit